MACHPFCLLLSPSSLTQCQTIKVLVFFSTRMHSSRIRTVCCSAHLHGRGCLPLVKTPPHRKTPTWGDIPPGQTPPPQCMLGYTRLWTEFLTETCENITFLQLRLRTVKTLRVNKAKRTFSAKSLNFAVYLSQPF